jgi:hypothetical protein
MQNIIYSSDSRRCFHCILGFSTQSVQSTMSSTSVMESQHREEKRIWYRSTLSNAFVIGAVGFLAPGLWNAMSSLGAGGAESPFLVNAANALVFGLSKPRSSIF